MRQKATDLLESHELAMDLTAVIELGDKRVRLELLGTGGVEGRSGHGREERSLHVGLA